MKDSTKTRYLGYFWCGIGGWVTGTPGGIDILRGLLIGCIGITLVFYSVHLESKEKE